jgi:MOSC domain-containing protein YiiM
VGTIKAICISKKKGEKKGPIQSAVLRAAHGIVGDAHAGAWGRQVSLLPRESIEKMRKVIPELVDGDFAENIVTAGVDMAGLKIGDRFRAGSGIVLEVTQIGKECHESCAIREKTGDCIMPREGVFCRVIEGGDLKIGDGICLDR